MTKPQFLTKLAIAWTPTRQSFLKYRLKMVFTQEQMHVAFNMAKTLNNVKTLLKKTSELEK